MNLIAELVDRVPYRGNTTTINLDATGKTRHKIIILGYTFVCFYSHFVIEIKGKNNNIAV